MIVSGKRRLKGALPALLLDGPRVGKLLWVRDLREPEAGDAATPPPAAPKNLTPEKRAEMRARQTAIYLAQALMGRGAPIPDGPECDKMAQELEALIQDEARLLALASNVSAAFRAAILAAVNREFGE